MRTLLIHNPQAGYEQPNGGEIMQMMSAAGYEVEYQATNSGDVESRFAEAWDFVVAAGGDGTVTKVLTYAAARPFPVAILPLGTANNVATALGHTGALQDLIEAWDPESRRPVDLGLATGSFGRRYFAESFGVGLMADTIAAADGGDADKARAEFNTVAERLEAQVKVVRHRLHNLKPERITLRTPENAHFGDYLWAEVSTVGRVGPGLPILENDDPGDGLLAFALLSPEDRAIYDQFLEHRRTGSAPRRTGLVTGRAATLTLEWSGIHAHIDGELLTQEHAAKGGEHMVRLDIQPGAVNVLRLAR